MQSDLEPNLTSGRKLQPSERGCHATWIRSARVVHVALLTGASACLIPGTAGSQRPARACRVTVEGTRSVQAADGRRIYVEPQEAVRRANAFLILGRPTYLWLPSSVTRTWSGAIVDTLGRAVPIELPPGE